MRRIEIPSAELQVSSYCLGTMYFGSKVPVDTSLTLLDAYADRGGNFLDSANKYASWIEGFSGGESERVIGRWLKDRPRDRFVVTSKVGFPYGDVPRSLRADVIVSECEKSLRRLGTDYIDIYFAHAEDAGTPVEETLRAFDKLIRDGKVRCIGASNHQAWRLAEAELMARAAGLPHYVVLQQRFSYLQPVVGADFGTQLPLTPEQTDFLCASWGVADGLLPRCWAACTRSRRYPFRFNTAANTAINCWNCCAAGLLNGGYTPLAACAGMDARSFTLCGAGSDGQPAGAPRSEPS